MAEMMSKASAPSQSVVLKEAEDEVEVGCRMLQGIGLNSEDGTVSVDISFNDTQSLTISEVKKLFRRAHIKNYLKMEFAILKMKLIIKHLISETTKIYLMKV